MKKTPRRVPQFFVRRRLGKRENLASPPGKKRGRTVKMRPAMKETKPTRQPKIRRKAAASKEFVLSINAAELFDAKGFAKNLGAEVSRLNARYPGRNFWFALAFADGCDTGARLAHERMTRSLLLNNNARGVKCD